MKKAYQLLLKLIELMIIVLASAMVLIVFINVLTRYFFHTAIAWTDESSRFLFIWLSFLGAILVNDKYEHMNLDFLVTSLPRIPSGIIKIISSIIVTVLFVLLTIGGVKVVSKNIAWYSSALEIEYAKVYAIVPVCCTIMAFQSLARLIRNVKALVKGEKGEEACN